MSTWSVPVSWSGELILAPGPAAMPLMIELGHRGRAGHDSSRQRSARDSAQGGTRTAVHPRVRLIAAQDAERRRIERDLHDGIQQEVGPIAGTARPQPIQS